MDNYFRNYSESQQAKTWLPVNIPKLYYLLNKVKKINHHNKGFSRKQAYGYTKLVLSLQVGCLTGEH